MKGDRIALGLGVAGIVLAFVTWSRPSRDGWWLVALVVMLAALVASVVRMVRGRFEPGVLATSFLLSVCGTIGLLLGLLTVGGPIVVEGRPLRRRRRVLLPALAGAPERADWARTARGEHASVPAFAKVSLDLAAVGAPLDLHERVHRAALEEVDHARRALALAGPGVTTGALPGRGRTLRLARMAVETFRDGCVGEGDAALRAASRTGVPDEEERAALAVIARDEAGHAELAWAILAWCVVEGGAPVAAVLRRELRRHPGHPEAVERALSLL